MAITSAPPFSEADVAALARIMERDAADLAAELHRRPWRIHDILTEPATVEAVLGESEEWLFVSPLLFFAVLVHRSADELADAQWVSEWTGPKQRLPLFDVHPLIDFAQRPSRLIHLAQVLTTFAAPTSELPVPVGLLDLDGLVDWLRSVEEQDQALLLRRLGDVALFLAGVCADQTGQKLLSTSDAERLGQSLGMPASDVLDLIDPASLSPGLDALEELGSRWYQAAAVQPTCQQPSLTFDLARHIRPARRFLNHLSDRHLHGQNAIGFGFLS